MLRRVAAAASVLVALMALGSTPVGAQMSAVAVTGAGALDAVACPGPESCVAVGVGNLAATQTDGSWDVASLPLPADAATAFQVTTLTSIACPTSNWCVAAGSYDTEAGVQHVSGLFETEADGSWEATSTAGLIPESVVCPVVNGCVAIETNGPGGTPIVATQSGGAWQTAPISLPGDASPGLSDNVSGLACPSNGS